MALGESLHGYIVRVLVDIFSHHFIDRVSLHWDVLLLWLICLSKHLLEVFSPPFLLISPSLIFSRK
jgi:hypothetical protein